MSENRFKVEIDLSDAAIQSDSMELSRIVEQLAERIQGLDVNMANDGAIHDLNGNRVGHWMIEATATCESCLGDGEEECDTCHNNGDMDCGKCRGLGTQLCTECEGVGHV